jgi:phospholipid/cholesterol/gamma-HCH transport system permease protein
MTAATARVDVAGPLTEARLADLRRAVRSAGRRHAVLLDLGGVVSCDAVTAARLLALVAEAREAGIDVRLTSPSPAVRAMLAGVPAAVLEPPGAGERPGMLVRMGTVTLDALDRAAEFLPLLRETLAGLVVPVGRRGIKWHLVVQQMAQAGARATGLVVFIAFLVGVVLALNGAIQLRQFGAQIFVANLVAISMTREMGPLITAILVAGRSGSAIAAELGTMVVSEEVDALRTMALSPARFLVVPKVVGLMLTMPLLTVLATAAGMLGGWTVGVLTLGLPSQAYLTQTAKSLFVSDVLTGLVKSVAFALIIALVGAFRGLSVRGGPEGVGRATTAAVVTAIILCIVANAGFTTLFYLVR